MRRLTSLIRIPLLFPLLSVLYAGARFMVISGQPATRFPDSIGFETLNFLGNNDRLWSVPFFYALIDLEQNRLIMQVILGSCAWTFLAWVLSSISRFPRATMTTVFVIGLAPQVVRFDAAILSESLGITFAVASVGATLLMTQSRQFIVRVSWIFLVVLTAFTRTIHLTVLFLIAAYAIGKWLISRRKKTALPALLFAFLSVWGVAQLRGNEPTSTLNFYTVLQQRVIRDDAMYAWFTKQGMPDLPGMRSAVGYNYTWELDPNVASIVQLPPGQQPPALMKAGGVSLAEWVRDNGWPTYARYVQSHPSYVTSLLRRMTPESLSPPTDAFLPLAARSVMWRGIFGPTWLWLLLLAVSLSASVLISRNKKALRAVISLTAASTVVFIGVHLTSAIEPQRHSVTTAVLLRVLVLASIAVLTARPTRSTTRDESDVELL